MRGSLLLEFIPVVWLFGLLIFLVLLSAFFSSSEIGMMSLNRYRLRHIAANKQSSRAERVLYLLKNPERLLGAILIGNTFANILASALATIIAVRFLGDIGVLIATILLTLVVLIFAEIAPKTLASIHPMQVAFAVSWPLLVLQKILSPLVWLANNVARHFLRLFGVKLSAQRKEELLDREELRTVVREAGTLISNDHKSMLVNILDLEKVMLEDIMVPRHEIVGIDLNDSKEQILEQLESSQHTRLPLYRGSIENVEGILHSRSIVNALMDQTLDQTMIKKLLLEIAEPCYFVPGGTTLYMQLLNFKKVKRRSCLVVDEYGNIQGLATIDDILEEIVGEFTTDIADMAKIVYPQENGSYVVDASAPIRDINRLLAINLPTEGPKTLSGLIIERLEFIPSANVSLRINHYPIEVMQTKDNTIRTAKIYPAFVAEKIN